MACRWAVLSCLPPTPEYSRAPSAANIPPYPRAPRSHFRCPQYHEDQALAIFGCFDGTRKGCIEYQSFIDKITSGFQITQKKFAAMLTWGERERQWAQLEQKHAVKFGGPGPQDCPPTKGRRAAPIPPTFGGGGSFDQNTEKEKVRQVYQAFAQYDGLGEGRIPSIQVVNGWLQEQDISASKADARRILSALDPCERDGDMVSFGEFWDWWQMAYGTSDAGPAEQKQRIEHYDMGVQQQRRGGPGSWKRRDSFGDTRNPHSFGATRAGNFVDMIKNRDSSYVPYFQRRKQDEPPASRSKMPVMPQEVPSPKKENYPLGRQQNPRQGRGHFVSALPNSTGINFSAHRGGIPSLKHQSVDRDMSNTQERWDGERPAGDPAIHAIHSESLRTVSRLLAVHILYNHQTTAANP